MTKGSDLLVAGLENEGVAYIFAIPGEENLDVLESLRRSKIKLVVWLALSTAQAGKPAPRIVMRPQIG